MSRREVADGLRRVPAAADAGDRGHPGVVPAAHPPVVDELQQEALREDGVAQVEPRELVLPRPGRDRQVLDEPVVEGAMVLELERADRVGDALDGVGLAVGEVVGRVDAPGVARPRVRRVQDPVEHRVAQVDVARGHVDLRAQHPGSVRELALAHAREEVEVLLDRAVAPGAVPARLGERPAVLPDLVRRQVVHVGLARPDEVRPPTRRAARSSRRRGRGARPSRSRASARPPRWRRCTPAPPSSGSCRRSGGGTGPRTPARCRSSGRSTWRGRCGGSRSARGGSG